MGDLITELPPPSRFFQDDLNNFVSPSPSLSLPFLVLSNPKPEMPLRPSLLIIALSSPSLYIFHHVSTKTLMGSLFLPETPLSGISVESSLGDRTCNIYSLSHGDSSILLVSMQHGVSAERSHLVARLLIGRDIIPERVLILDSIQSRNFRGKLSPDETYAFKLETLAERKGSAVGTDGLSLLKGLDYFPSGSMIDGLGAALLSRCQLKNIKGTLCVSWPEFGNSVVALIRSLLQSNVLPGLDVSLNGEERDQYARLNRNRIKHKLYDTELYT